MPSQRLSSIFSPSRILSHRRPASRHFLSSRHSHHDGARLHLQHRRDQEAGVPSTREFVPSFHGPIASPPPPHRTCRVSTNTYQLTDTTYLDHGGTTLYASSLINAFTTDLSSNLYGNPHSASPSSALSTKIVEDVRLRTLRFFNADPRHFDLVFVANASAALRLVGECMRDYAEREYHSRPLMKRIGRGKEKGFKYLYHYDGHNSLVGIRELASSGGSSGGGVSHCFTSDAEVDVWLSGRHTSTTASISAGQPTLFAYPAQSNLNGHRPPLSWPGRIRASPLNRNDSIFTLLDAAAYVTSSPLDLSDEKNAPDFVTLSFYKIFGFPNLGALLVRKASGARVLRSRRYFGGGTVDMVIAASGSSAAYARRHMDPSRSGEEGGAVHGGCEDGTLPFHAIIALGRALEVHEQIYGPRPMERVSKHCAYLAKVLHDAMASLVYPTTGYPVLEIYAHPDSIFGDTATQGPTVAFNVLHSSGKGWVGKSVVERLANERNIHLRQGGMCNPGGIARSLSMGPAEFERNWRDGMRCGDGTDVIRGKPTGVLRVGLGAMSSLGDVEAFLRFLKEEIVEGELAIAGEEVRDVRGEEALKMGVRVVERGLGDGGEWSRESSDSRGPGSEKLTVCEAEARGRKVSWRRMLCA